MFNSLIDLNTVSAIDFGKEFAEFISAAPSSYHAAAWEVQQLIRNDFQEQNECDAWQGYRRGFLQRAGAVIAWQLPEKITPTAGFRIIGAHNDSPGFKIKPNPDTSAFGFSQVNVEVYGGPLLNSWLNRDLGLAGQVALNDGTTRLVKTPPLMFIPQLAPHLDRGQNTQLQLTAQGDFRPIWAVREGESVAQYLAQCLALQTGAQIVGTDLYAYDAQAPQIFGGQSGQDFFAAGRQDNLSSVFAALQAFFAATAPTTDATLAAPATSVGVNAGVNLPAPAVPAASAGASGKDVLIFAAFDHEEVGSDTFTGAAGAMLEHVLRRICAALTEQIPSVNDEVFARMLANSSCISADAGHSINPNQAQKHDPAHRVGLGKGVLLKLNAQQRYATEAQGIALWKRACAAANTPTQDFVSNNDVPCGSTIGPAIATRLGIRTVDVGIPLLSMHSVREISALNDLLGLAKAAKEYYAGA